MNYEIFKKLNDAMFLISKITRSGGFVLAGGFVRDVYMGVEPKDIDVFFDDQTKYNEAVEQFEYHAKKIKQRKNSTVFKMISGQEIDLVFTQHKLNEVHNSFDLHHCCISFDGEIMRHSSMFCTAASDMELILNVVTLPWLTLSRIAKFKSRGWKIIEEQERLILDYCYKAPWGISKESEYQH